MATSSKRSKSAVKLEVQSVCQNNECGKLLDSEDLAAVERRKTVRTPAHSSISAQEPLCEKCAVSQMGANMAKRLPAGV